MNITENKVFNVNYNAKDWNTGELIVEQALDNIENGINSTVSALKDFSIYEIKLVKADFTLKDEVIWGHNERVCVKDNITLPNSKRLKAILAVTDVNGNDIQAFGTYKVNANGSFKYIAKCTALTDIDAWQEVKIYAI